MTIKRIKNQAETTHVQQGTAKHRTACTCS